MLNQAIANLYELSRAQLKIMSEDPNVNLQDRVTSSEVNRITKHTFKGNSQMFQTIDSMYGHRRHDLGKKCPAIGKIRIGSVKRTISTVYVYRVLHLNQEE